VRGLWFVDPPRAGREAVRCGDFHAKPRGADGGGVSGLLGVVEELFDTFLTLMGAPRPEKTSDGVDAEDLLEGQRNLRPHDLRQREVENRILHHDVCPISLDQQPCHPDIGVAELSSYLDFSVVQIELSAPTKFRGVRQAFVT